MKKFVNRCINYWNDKNLSYIINRLFYKLIILILGIFLFPIAIYMHLKKYRILKIDTARIGHFAIEPDIILKGERLGFLKKYKYIIPIQDKKKLINI